ncbi:MAG: hypothetical protein K5683_03235 [Prevotella sp.]|nr:hypothetical protein [Prevotella sp.]
MVRDKIYVAIMTTLVLGLTVLFTAFPRSTFSELEKRELASFPHFSLDSLMKGSFTREVSLWFSDSEPYRDVFMELSMQVKQWMKLETSDDNVTFHAAETPLADNEAEADTVPDLVAIMNDTLGVYEHHVTADGTAKIANAGIIIVGKGDSVRALMAYGGSAKGGLGYAEAANLYKRTFGAKVNVYCMVIPTSVEFYCPEKVQGHTRPQRPTIDNIHAHLSADVKAVDIYTPLSAHAGEDIYLRTDHHWAPLGAYYAAQKFAQVAGVPFCDLSSYERKVVHRYVGSMYGYSKDISVKKAPEDFVYYMPRGVEYETTYIDYSINEDYQVTGEGRPYRSSFFFHYKDGSGGAYCTFMGSDTKLTQVRTSTRNGRRVLILKDSFGNAIPGYLFFSFDEVHVVDFRYFTKNMKAYVEENKITDILFANNIFNAISSYACRNYARFLAQKAGTYAPATPKDSLQQARDTTVLMRDDSLQRAVEATNPANDAEQPAEQPVMEQTDDARQVPAAGGSVN